MIERLPTDWETALAGRFDESQFERIRERVAQDRAKPGVKVYPPDAQVFAAFQLTRFAEVQAVILGQDPYHQPGDACGLAFSVSSSLPPERRRPRALVRPSPLVRCLRV